MAIVSIDELMSEVTAHLGNTEEDLKIIEDISDTVKSYTVNAGADWESDENPYIAKYNDIVKRYKERFAGNPDKYDKYDKDDKENDISDITIDDIVKEEEE